MVLVVIGDGKMKDELLAHGTTTDLQVRWIEDITLLKENSDCDAVIDLLFQTADDRANSLNKLYAGLVIINYVSGTLAAMPSNFVRVNGWPGFLQRPVAEVAVSNDDQKDKVIDVFRQFNKTVEFVADRPGFITASVVSMIINEAFISLGENVSTRSEIDTAMKLGTNYPYGPFEWAEKIGVENIFSLLTTLSSEEPRYSPSRLLENQDL